MRIKSLVFLLAAAATPVVLSAQVLDLGGGGAFTNAINPSNGGRGPGGWFFDNLSADAAVGATQCNVGFFAVGTMSNGCLNVTPGTLANQGGFAGGTVFGSGDGYQPAPFMFSGSYDYNLRLVGAVAGENSEFGIFTIDDNQNYVFTAIPLFGSKVINSTYSVLAGGDWGFYIRNGFNPTGGGCSGTDYHCSDATGGFDSAPFQQFVLMRSAGPDGPDGNWRFLVGAEDNKLDLLPNGSFYDSDYNDYIVEVTTTTTPEPISMALMATGLVGLAGAGLVQRRRRTNAAD